jgi:hypothetical protein
VATLVSRATKGSALDLPEMDANFDALNLLSVRTSGTWKSIPPLFRLRMTGTGTCTLDAQNSLGTINYAVVVYTVTSATNQIEYPYLGDDAVSMRVTLTGTCTAEVI